MIMEGKLLKTTLLLSVCAALLLAGCTSVRLGLDYDTSTDFSSLRTFAWHPESHQEDAKNSQNPLIDARIRTAIEETLISKGYEKVVLDSADFLVGFHFSVERKLEVSSMNATFGYSQYGRGGSLGYQTSVTEYDEGIIVIDIAEAETDALVWRGSGARRVGTSNDPDKVTKKVNRAVSEILSQFPPK
jgi:hypothetical protein